MDSKKFRNGIHLQPLNADPSNPAEGDIFVSDGTSRGKGLWIYKDGSWTKAGGGSGGLDVFLAEDFQSTKASNFSSGNNASFLGGGTLAGTLADEEANPIAGNRSIKLTLATGSANDYIAAPAITLDAKQKGQDVGITFYYTYNGADDDITLIVYDVTNASVISSSLDLIKAASSPTRFSTSVFIPSTCNSIRYGFKVNSASGSEVFVFDDVEISTNPFIYKEIARENEFSARIANNGTATVVSQNCPFIQSVSRTAAGTVSVTFVSNFFSVAPSVTISKESQGWASIEAVTTSGFTVKTKSNDNTAFIDSDFSVHISRQSSDYGQTTEHVITPAKSNMSEWIDAGNLEISATTSAPTKPTTMEVDKVFCRRIGDSMEVRVEFKWNSNVGAAAGSGDYLFKIPTSFGGYSNLQINTTKVTAYNTVEGSGFWTATNIVGNGTRSFAGGDDFPSSVVVYDSQYVRVFDNHDATGGGAWGSAWAPVTGSSGAYLFRYTVPIAGWDANATFLAAVPVEKVARVYESRPSGVSSSTSISNGAYAKCAVNTVSGDTDIVSLSSSQFTLGPGKYVLSGTSPYTGYQIGAVNYNYKSRLRIRNVSDGTTVGTGQGVWFNIFTSSNNTYLHGTCTIEGIVIELTESKTFEIQQYCYSNSSQSIGSPIGTGEEEVYTQLTIRKLK